MNAVTLETDPSHLFRTDQGFSTEITWSCAETDLPATASDWEVSLFAEAADSNSKDSSLLLARTTLPCPTEAEAVHQTTLEVPAGSLTVGAWQLIAVLTQAQGWRTGFGIGPVIQLSC